MILSAVPKASRVYVCQRCHKNDAHWRQQKKSFAEPTNFMMSSLLIMKRKNYSIGKKLGSGSQATVYRAKNCDGEPVAVKRMRPPHADGVGFSTESLRETATLVLLRDAHPNIVRVQGVRAMRTGIVDVLLPLCSGTLYNLLKNTPNLSVARIRAFAQQLSGALAACHVRGVVHRDVKPENILVNSDGSALLLADFGSSLLLNGRATRVSSPQMVTIWYRPIETLLGSCEYSCATDVWSMGCVVAEIVRGGNPLLNLDNELSMLLEIAMLFGPPQPALWPGVDALPNYAKINWSSPERARPPMKLLLHNRNDVAWLEGPLARCFDYVPTQRITASMFERQIV